MKVRRSRLITVQRVPEAGTSVGGEGGCRGVEYNLDVQEASRSAERFFRVQG